jgi:anaerobic selenocysteine-containing dehydrogenase
MNKTYLVEELFQDIPNDPDNVLFTIPPEICEQLGWKEGDTIHIEAEEGQLKISKV